MIIANDLEALINFRNHLMDFDRTLQDEYSRISGHWREMGEVWRDEKYRELSDELEDVHSGIKRYLAVTDHLETYLLGRIEALGEYLQR